MAERVSVELALAWRWRCEADNQLFSGSTLRIKNSGVLVPLAELRDAKVDRSDLRHGCGSGKLIPVAPDLDYRPSRAKT